MSRRTMTSGAVLLSIGEAKTRIEALGHGLVHVEIMGVPDAELARPFFAEIELALGREGGQIFYDATLIQGQAPEFRDAFTEWLLANPDRVRALHLHCPNALVAMSFAVIGLGDRLQVHDDPIGFRTALRGQLTRSGIQALEDDDF